MISDDFDATKTVLGPNLGWTIAIAIPVLAVATELMPAAFGSGEKAAWDWSFLFVTMKFVVLPIGGTLAGLAALALGRLFRWPLLPSVVPLLVAIAYDVQLALYPGMWLWLLNRAP